jgi:hypothetical protein
MTNDNNWMFSRQITKSEELVFRKWSRDNYQAGSKIPTFWHPVVRDECAKMNEEKEIQNEVDES